ASVREAGAQTATPPMLVMAVAGPRPGTVPGAAGNVSPRAAYWVLTRSAAEVIGVRLAEPTAAGGGRRIESGVIRAARAGRAARPSVTAALAASRRRAVRHGVMGFLRDGRRRGTMPRREGVNKPTPAPCNVGARLPGEGGRPAPMLAAVGR